MEIQKKTVIHCQDCHNYMNGKCQIDDNSPLYRCNISIIENFVKKLRPADQVLEIGCGSWDFCKNLVVKSGALWEGIDPLKLEKNKEVVATQRGSVRRIPFEANRFDYVIGNQTMEHWHEFGAGFEESMNEIYRVLKPGGIFILNVPIHLHGHRIFLLDDRKKMEELFNAALWDSLEVEEWRHDPREPYFGWKRCRYSARVFPELENKSSYVLNFIGRKSQSGFAVVCVGPSSRGAMKRAALALARLSTPTRLLVYHLHYGLSHLLYKLKLRS